MKKLMLILMPITIIIAIICVIASKNIQYIDILEGLSKLEFSKFPSKEIDTALSYLDMSDIWVNIWDNVNNIVDWFGAIGNSLKAIGESIIRIGQLIWGVINFGFQFIKWFWENFIKILQFVGYYIGILYE